MKMLHCLAIRLIWPYNCIITHDGIRHVTVDAQPMFALMILNASDITHNAGNIDAVMRIRIRTYIAANNTHNSYLYHTCVNITYLCDDSC